MDLNLRISSLCTEPIRRVAIVSAEDAAVLKAAVAAQNKSIAEPLLFGDETRIRRIAETEGIDLASCQIVHANNAAQAAQNAILHIKSGEAYMLMKGYIPTADFLRAVLDRENGLRHTGTLSHVAIVHDDVLGRPILITDAAMIPYPDLKTKVNLIDNAVFVARHLGISVPKVAVLAAVETINPDMPATLDAAALVQMNRQGQIKDCLVDGPLAMDLALSRKAALHKSVHSEVAGNADILVFHNIEAANSVLKTFTTVAGSLFGGVVIGAAVPIVVSSRSDSIENKLYSIACAAAVCNPESAITDKKAG